MGIEVRQMLRTELKNVTGVGLCQMEELGCWLVKEHHPVEPGDVGRSTSRKLGVKAL